jgi:hypothetical protein
MVTPLRHQLCLIGRATGARVQLDDLDRLEMEPGFGDEATNPIPVTQQHRHGELLVEDHLSGAQYLLVLTLGEDHPLGLAPGLVDHHPHDAAGLAQTPLELLAVLLEVDLLAGHAGGHRRLGHRRGLPDQHPRVERLGNQVVGPEAHPPPAVGLADGIRHVLFGQRRQGAGGRQLHLLVDRRRPRVESAAEDEREAEDVVDLVGVVGPPRGHDHVLPRLFGLGVGDLGGGVGHGEDDRTIGHRSQHLGGDAAGHRQADKDVGPHHRLCQRAGRRIRRQLLLEGVEALALGVHDAAAVAENQVLASYAEIDVVVGAGDAGGAGAVEDHPNLLDRLADQLQGVEQGRPRDDRGTVLVIVEDRDVHLAAQGLLDLEALGRLDVLQVDATEGRFEKLDKTDDLGRVVRGDLEVEDVYVGKPLEQQCLALHHRLACLGADVTQAEHRGAVGDHRHQISSTRVGEDVLRPRRDSAAGHGDARRVGERKIPLADTRLARYDLQLPRPALAVIVERVLFTQHLSPPVCRAAAWPRERTRQPGPAHIILPRRRGRHHGRPGGHAPRPPRRVEAPTQRRGTGGCLGAVRRGTIPASR